MVCQAEKAKYNRLKMGCKTGTEEGKEKFFRHGTFVKLCQI